MTRRELAAFELVADAVIEPVAPLPPVRETDAALAFARSLAAGPRPNELVLRAIFWALAAWLRRRDVAARGQALARLDREPLAPLMKAVRSLVYLHYYGDARVMRLLGYDADVVVARAAEVRVA